MPIVIGITGATRSGKGRVSRALALALGGATIVGQDKFWFRPWPDAATGELSEEEPECTNHSIFAEKIQEAIASGARFVIAEGFLLLHDASVRALLGPIHLLELSRDECIRRRSAPRDEHRNPNPINAMKMKEVVWPAYLRHCAASINPLGARVVRHEAPTTDGDVEATVGKILASLRGPVDKGPVYITNIGHPSFLDCDCTSAQAPDKYNVTVWGDAVDIGQYPEFIQWYVIPVENEAMTYFIVNKGHNKFLEPHGRGLWLWGDGVNMGQNPDGIKWRLEGVAGAVDTFYLIHKKSNKFLDSPGGCQVSLWGDGLNKGEFPQNLQWQLRSVRIEE